MDVIIHNYKRFENESDEELIYRVSSEKEQIGTWNDVAAILNELTGNFYDESTYRKKFQVFNKMLQANQSKFVDNTVQLEELRFERQSLEKEKVKMRDERNELKRMLREEARKESYKEQVLRSISEYVPTPLSYDKEKQFSGILKSDNDLLISCFDVHAGIKSNNFINTFNEDVLKQRLNKYLDKIFEIQLRHGSENAYLVLSELVSGFIHPTLRIENNQDMIEQFLCVVNYIAEFLTELSYRFNNIHVYIAPGNHGRLNAKKEDNLSNENMDNLVLPFLEAKLQNFNNAIFHQNDIEQSIAMFSIRNSTVFSSHGDKESMEKAIPNLTLFTGIRPDIYLCGHRHTNAMITVYDSKVLQAGCISGADAYCMDNRLKNRPEQLVAVIDDDGLDCLYDVKF